VQLYDNGWAGASTASTDEGAKFIVFQVGPTGEPIMVPTQ
jgi:hypothetical protein